MFREVEPANQRLVNLPKAGEVEGVEEVEVVEHANHRLVNQPKVGEAE